MNNKIYQIYYHESQIQGLDYTPLYNAECTVFFENSVIANQLPDMETCDYYGVLAWKLREKIGQARQWKGLKIANTSDKPFSVEAVNECLVKHRPDVMSLQRHAPHDPVTYADRFHPNFSTYYKSIMNAIGFNWRPTHFNDVVYCNYFVATPEIYSDYVKTMLIPAMKVMESMPELMNNSGYPHQLPDALKDSFGIKHYPYHPFICERFFSYYIHLKRLKCVHF